MKSAILLVLLVCAFQWAQAQRHVDGFKLLGPVPSLQRAVSKFYYINENFVDWQTAFRSCVEQGGQLATPFNPIQDNALRQYLVTEGDFAWVGGKAIGNKWRWLTTGQSFTYQQFADPLTTSCTNVDACLHVGHNSETLEWFWCGFNCTQPRKFVCEF